MNTTQQIVMSAVYAALSAGMPGINVETYSTLVITRIAAGNIGLDGAAKRADSILAKLMNRTHQDVVNTLLPSQRIAEPESEINQMRLMSSVLKVMAELDGKTI